ncbi:carboxypeptidase-like regulatory domain-containing protein [Ulvibacter antarcticus]|uniref:Carboxypeptidase-like protein n=1 Tax=Ulvibacter antarcticus TaxID=442714 RepID=A0A3L9Z3E6_9FLAO|nr:carboxypeptidase-like regulatory domain-containing protein [Ulvibacter antarcticus]RMA64858.1 carboxypeptidase-like protein [Ulvibacter antarcticus]
MKKAITIRIPEPCHENWTEMSPTEKGKFCGVCTKEVIDFTAKTDEDLVKTLSGKTNVCGRFKKNQLDREVKLERKSGINLAPYAASLLLPLSLLGNSGTMNGNNEASEKSAISLGIGRYSNPDRILIYTTGRIFGQDGAPISNVKITTSENDRTFYSDDDGYYRVRSLDRETLTYTKSGYELHTFKTGIASSKQDIFLNSPNIQSMILGKIAIPKETYEEIQGDIVQIEEPSEEKVSEEINIKGTITDEAGLPLPGVNIIIEGTNDGTQSDFEGNYNIEAEPGQKLVISYVGYETQTITLSNISNTLDVQMYESYDVLGGMVIISCRASYEEVEKVSYSLTLDEVKEKRAQIKQANENTRAFNKIKQARKKAARELRKGKK